MATKDRTIRLRVATEEAARWEKEAASQGVSLSELVRQRMVSAVELPAGETVLPKPLVVFGSTEVRGVCPKTGHSKSFCLCPNCKR